MTPIFATMVLAWQPLKIMAEDLFHGEDSRSGLIPAVGTVLKRFGETIRIGTIPMTAATAALFKFQGKDFFEAGDLALEPVSSLILASIVMDLWGHTMQRFHFKL